jgi:hypothetical protein
MSKPKKASSELERLIKQEAARILRLPMNLVV